MISILQTHPPKKQRLENYMFFQTYGSRVRLNQMIISRLFYEIVPICITTYSSEQEGKFLFAI